MSIKVKDGNSPADWKKVRGELHMETSGAFRRVFYTHWVPPVSGKASFVPVRILFISDLHLSLEYSRSLFPGSLKWEKADFIREFILETVERYKVDHLLFGGDLLTYLCGLEEAYSFFEKIRVPGRKIGVYGNWDLKRPWISYAHWEKTWKEKASLELLCNQATQFSGIRLYAMDEFRNGTPHYTPPETPQHQNWILTHNPDAIVSTLEKEDLAQTDLILCGHTHGGQIRLPYFGAIQTSSIFWKHFEYGLYLHRQSGAKLLITSGLGTTLYPLRFLCPPEAVIIDVKQDPSWSQGSTEA